jgi:hypothetical protein
MKTSICACLEEHPRRKAGMVILPYQELLAALWSDEYR